MLYLIIAWMSRHLLKQQITSEQVSYQIIGNFKILAEVMNPPTLDSPPLMLACHSCSNLDQMRPGCVAPCHHWAPCYRILVSIFVGCGNRLLSGAGIVIPLLSPYKFCLPHPHGYLYLLPIPMQSGYFASPFRFAPPRYLYMLKNFVGKKN